jgi:hypothetical protein
MCLSIEIFCNCYLCGKRGFLRGESYRSRKILITDSESTQKMYLGDAQLHMVYYPDGIEPKTVSHIIGKKCSFF